MPDMSADILPARVMAKSRPVTVSVIIPTFRRPEGLRRAVTSILRQTGTGDLAIRIVVCDNSPAGCARPTFDALAAEAALPLVYVHEPHAGVANARNAAVAASEAEFIAFLDDDEEAPSEWLVRLFVTQRRFDADVVFGPVKARLDDATREHRAYYTCFFSRFGPRSSEILGHYYGCGNSLLRAALLAGPQPFSPLQNDMGGEDDILFTALKKQGAVMAWAVDAPVWEDVPLHRATLAYTMRRGFAYGQGPSHSAAVNGRWPACAGWMIQGAAQAVIFAIIGAVSCLARNPKTAFRLDKAARGLGKLLWFPPFKMKFYGQALLKKKAMP